MKAAWKIVGIALAAYSTTLAQRGDITVPTGAEVTVPAGALLCADRYYANNPGYGTLNYGNDPTRLCGAVIPVEFLSLSAKHHNGAVTVIWRAASEKNCAGYEVQRSMDESMWEASGFVPGHGTAPDEYAYSFEDVLTSALKNAAALYYRLKQMDNDGSFGYSPVVEVSTGGTKDSPALQAAYPNPASDRITVRYSVPDDVHARISVYSMAGQEVMAFEGSELSGPGEHILSVNTSALPTGNYLVELNAGGKRLVRRLVVNR